MCFSRPLTRCRIERPIQRLPTSTIPRKSARTTATSREETRSLRVDADECTMLSECLASETICTERSRYKRQFIDTVERFHRHGRAVSTTRSSGLTDTVERSHLLILRYPVDICLVVYITHKGRAPTKESLTS